MIRRKTLLAHRNPVISNPKIGLAFFTATRTSIGLACAFLAGCAGTFKSNVNFNPAQPIRIAVLPFAQVDDKGVLAQVDENYLIDNVLLVSSKLKETPAQFTQNLVQSELSKASLDVINPGIVEAELLHHGFEKEGAKPVQYDLAKTFAASPAEICKDILSCDAVLYGRVTKWDRSYYGIQAVATVALELKLVSAKDGKVLFESTAEDSDSRGVTKGPTGFSNLVIEPLKGLDNEIITDLARSVVQGAVNPLYVKNRPEFLKSSPPAIVAAAHDANNGVIPRITGISVVALGSPAQIASFSIGTVVLGVPMVERAPGHYIGEYFPLPSDNFTPQKITVSLRDQFGRVTTLKLGKTAVSLQ